MLIFRQLFDASSSTCTYLVADAASRQAVLVDPVFEQVLRDVALLRELDLVLAWTLDTHVHADHVTGAWLLRARLGSRIAVGARSGATGADRLLAHGDRIEFGRRHLDVRATPGHTAGCVSYVLDDGSRAFTGDCLLVRGCGRTDFQGGDARALYASVHRQLFSLRGDCLLYPGHDYGGLAVTSVDEERRFNPRLGDAIGEDDFVGHMRHLALPHPRRIDAAVPANLRCGEPSEGQLPQAEPRWARLRYTFGGLWEIEPRALLDCEAPVQVVDVREYEEIEMTLSRGIDGALSIPLGELPARLHELSRDRPVVAVCRSGSRSARAVALLRSAGFTDVANLAGGMQRWDAEGSDDFGAAP